MCRYIILQGLSGTAAGFLQIVSLVVYYVKLVLFGSTPRSVYGVKYGASSVQWGTLFPMTTLLSVIGMQRSITVSRTQLTHFSYRILDHLSDHQWPRLCHLLPLLPVVQVPLPLGVPARYRYWRSVLPQSTSTPVCGDVRRASMCGCPILPLAGSKQASKRCSRGCADDCVDHFYGMTLPYLL